MRPWLAASLGDGAEYYENPHWLVEPRGSRQDWLVRLLLRHDRLRAMLALVTLVFELAVYPLALLGTGRALPALFAVACAFHLATLSLPVAPRS